MTLNYTLKKSVCMYMYVSWEKKIVVFGNELQMV